MVNIYYVGFNAYKQCPYTEKPIPCNVLSEWTCFKKSLFDIECTFFNVLIYNSDKINIYGLINERNNLWYRELSCPKQPQAVLAQDDFLIISEGNKLWRSEFSNSWSDISYSLNKNEDLWNDKKIIKMCYLCSTSEVIILLDNGSVWKLNESYELSVLFLPEIDKAIDISCGFEHGLILTQNGCVLSFGNSSRGQLGHGNLNSSPDPLQVLDLGGLMIVKICCGGWHSGAVSDSGDLYLWGWNNFGQLSKIDDDGNDCEIAANPVLIDIDAEVEKSVVDIVCGTRHTVILTDGNELFSTGWNEYGQLGINDVAVKQVNKFTKCPLKLRKGNIQLKCGPWSTIVIDKNSN